MKEHYKPSLTSVTLAVTNMDSMLAFYSEVFGIQFSELEMYDTKLFRGKWGAMDLLLCPAEVAQNTAKQNRHQLEFVTLDLLQTLQVVIASGGEKMGEIIEDREFKSCGVYDPDRNSVVFKEPIS